MPVGLLSVVLQIVASFFTIKGFLAKDFSLFPYIAIIYVITDIIEIASGRLKSGIWTSVIACIMSCCIYQAVNIYTISIGYVLMQAIFFVPVFVLTTICLILRTIGSIFSR